ncbi:uncharacterized protein BCR38DRAFT_353195 [Pseudomassariella vexata]|uniref:Phosphatidate phosphatase APP1 catalytic domain-containing protein n=1 Tax=Pseudomassariella vexata TaxID=1141098 RepID=A0A1Y2DGK6_9PEZI|nr:uncharacterized protein BCR38DRAFT_353195 [Pseudomassariella vexata]ORY58388.1 hypothetical protein BCR38DRAFT_353195 [Pseudomassariella vexata]
MAVRYHNKSPVEDMQLQTRKERRFLQTEADLSDLAGNVSPTSPMSPQVTATSKLNDMLSYLGSRNPMPRQVAKDDTVWLLDNTAYRNQKTGGGWEAEFVSAVFAQHPSCVVIEAVAAVAKELDLDEKDPNYSTIKERILPFLQDIKPGTQVKALENGHNLMKLGPGGRNGISNDIKPLKGPDSDGLVKTYAQVPLGADGVLELNTFYAEPEGWGVISADIDDTIKISMTSDPIGILRSTFVDKPTPCPGMAELYAYMDSLIRKTDPPYFYLSASPYNLYPFLRDFRNQAGYPQGTIILRDSSWSSIPGLLSSLTMGTEGYKVDRMKKIRGWLPKRKMICIGDSTQSDPEAYGEIYRAFPGWVKLILIRKVTDIAAIGIESKNEPERFEKAFKDVPRGSWHVFEDPAECRNILAETVVLEE